MPNKETREILKEEEKRKNAQKKKKHERETEEQKYTDLQTWIKKPFEKRLKEANLIAQRMARIEPSDPFVFEIVLSHLINGVTSPKDYEGIAYIMHSSGHFKEKLEKIFGPLHLAEHGAKLK